jgi:hypothetical protein
VSHTGSAHGPRKDDALKRETRGEVQANRATRVEEWREPEPPGEDQPDATWAPADSPDPVQVRSDLARYFGRTTFPADRHRLRTVLARNTAPGPLLDLTAALPAQVTFHTLSDVLRALGLRLEEGRHP